MTRANKSHPNKFVVSHTQPQAPNHQAAHHKAIIIQSLDP